ncbi:histidine kinase [Pseudomonas sp. 2822-15]|uniref:histidine kinase n=1 Tax=Pseudomonas salomonii TaxID=191391 RepID=A0A1H3RR74_9PSED|nr:MULTISPECIES: PAS domain-containing sensor histidine kinase [Pseudomonas]NWF07540.1 PAS domain-containing sensor histidine kinase [Pseudomonas salomonii]PIB42338.1 histidine kinase [Pseudomonas sp. 2822-15]CRM17865.1 Bacteriophytochrome [Pseudomonas sp. 58 R 3]SDZ28187.1 sigma-B regulation protein RsbU (phosphoserine phosphatase) [Pseudomonas salomonii]
MSADLFDSAACALAVTTEDGTILRANTLFGEWLGLRSAELCGRRFQDLLTMGGRIFHQTHLAPMLRMRGSVSEVKLDLVHHDGHKVTVLLNASAREQAGALLHEIALFGTTDRDKYERELLNARKLAEALLQERTSTELALHQAQAELSEAYAIAQRRALFAEQMVAIVSHDLKNPLTAIRMATDILARSERTPKERQLLGHIGQSSERAQRMIADLLDFTQARVGHGISIKTTPLDLHSVILHAVDELRVAFPTATLKHQAEGMGEACLDADRVQQIIGNLVANSVAYGDLLMPITITSRLGEGGCQVAVHNHGAAIPQTLLAGLFEPMTRGTDQGSEVRSVGLGLYIVRELAKAHGGDVVVSSCATKGTTFTVTF